MADWPGCSRPQFGAQDGATAEADLAGLRAAQLPKAYLRRNVPFCSSSKACRNSCCVFITIGPYQATGS